MNGARTEPPKTASKPAPRMQKTITACQGFAFISHLLKPAEIECNPKKAKKADHHNLVSVRIHSDLLFKVRVYGWKYNDAQTVIPTTMASISQYDLRSVMAFLLKSTLSL